MIKKIKLLFTFILTFLIAINTRAETLNTQQVDSKITGIYIENGKKYFLENGEKITGFKEWEGNLYFFSSIDKSASTGWKYAYGKSWYQNEEGIVLRGIQVLNNEKYYFNETTGYNEVGFKEVAGNLYYFSGLTKTTSPGWKLAYGKSWYQNEEGIVLRGLQTIEEKTYYFNETTGYNEVGFKEVNGTLYYFSGVDKALSSGWKLAYGKSWYQNEEGIVLRGLQTIEEKTYYFNEITGYNEVGFKEVNGTLYYFSGVDRALSSGWKYAYGKAWYQDQNGIVLRGINEVDNTLYYFDDVTGYRSGGFKEYNGNLYYFSGITGTITPGWKCAYGNIWYQDQEGIVLKGNQNIEGRDYIFDENGYLQGFRKENNNLYYYNPDGTMAKGVQRMAGTYYKFNELTGVFEKFVNQKIVIDVSVHNGTIDWDKVKNSGKVDGVILRLGYGVKGLDNKFLRNVKELNRLGIPYSVYLFSYAENSHEAGLEADFLINTIKNNPVNIASNLFSIYYDLETWSIPTTGENSHGISKETYGEMITTFVNKVEKSLGIKTRVYASKNYITDRFPEYAWPYVTWIAQWGPELTYKGAYEGWQYTSDGSIPGIDGRVDMNIFYY